jgi:hypothetical protein
MSHALINTSLRTSPDCLLRTWLIIDPALDDGPKALKGYEDVWHPARPTPASASQDLLRGGSHAAFMQELG